VDVRGALLDTEAQEAVESLVIHPWNQPFSIRDGRARQRSGVRRGCAWRTPCERPACPLLFRSLPAGA
jgi:hypothetical protein